MPRVQKRNIDDILLALEGPKQESLPPSSQRDETLQGKQTPLPPISPSKDPTEEMVTDVPDHGNKEQTGDAFFMTQVVLYVSEKGIIINCRALQCTSGLC